MTRKRKAPSSIQTQEQKPKPKQEKVVTSESEEEDSSSSSSEESEEAVDTSAKEESKESSSSSSSSEEESESESDEANNDASKRQLIRKLLEPLTKPQIIGFLKKASRQDPQILSKIVQVADTDPTYRKIFARGISSETTSQDLVEAFEPFGEIEEYKLIKDKRSGRAKQYAFVTFKTRAGAEKALKVPQKKIGNRIVSCNLAALGNPNSNAAAGGGNDVGRKIYIGNVSPNVSYEGLKAFFERFGEIEDGPTGFDFVENRFSKGFAAIVYKTVEGYEKAMEGPIKMFDNCQLYCKKFVENSNNSNGVGGGVGNSNTLAPSTSDVIGVNASRGIMSTNANPNLYANSANNISNYSTLGLNNASGILNLAGLLNPGLGFQLGNAILSGGYNPSPLMGPGFPLPIGNYGINSVGSSVMPNYWSQGASQGLGAFQNVHTQGLSSIGTQATIASATRDTDESGETSSSLGVPSFLNC